MTSSYAWANTKHIHEIATPSPGHPSVADKAWNDQNTSCKASV